MCGLQALPLLPAAHMVATGYAGSHWLIAFRCWSAQCDESRTSNEGTTFFPLLVGKTLSGYVHPLARRSNLVLSRLAISIICDSSSLICKALMPWTAVMSLKLSVEDGL